jgi:UDP-glucose 4-epimerase
MRVLITGGAGFLESRLTKTLLSLDHEVTVIDNFYTGHGRSLLKKVCNGQFLTLVV